MTSFASQLDLRDLIRTIPDYPKPGILFRDITTLIADPAGFRAAVDGLVWPFLTARVDLVAGIEARGFILGGAVAHELGRGFVPIRKKGKLPAKTIGQDYSLEYGVDTIEIHADAIKPGDRVLVVDDLIATGAPPMRRSSSSAAPGARWSPPPSSSICRTSAAPPASRKKASPCAPCSPTKGTEPHADPALLSRFAVRAQGPHRGPRHRRTVTVVDTDTRAPDPAFYDENPLGKIPVLVLDDGTTIYDSPVILDYLDHLAGGGVLIPTETAARFAALKLQALADGLMDAALLQVYEVRFRPEARRHPEWVSWQAAKSPAPSISSRAPRRVPKSMSARSPSPAPSVISICASTAAGGRTIRAWWRGSTASPPPFRPSRRRGRSEAPANDCGARAGAASHFGIGAAPRLGLWRVLPVPSLRTCSRRRRAERPS